MKYEIINLISTHYSLILIKEVLHISNLVLFELFSCYCHIFYDFWKKLRDTYDKQTIKRKQNKTNKV